MTTSDEMGNYCHDHLNHPLFWCEDKKRLEERKNAEESLRMWRRRKAEELARKEKEKQEYHELYLKHCPWGKPGGGAPNMDVRRKDITAIGLHSTPTIAEPHRLSSVQPCRYSDYFSKRKKCHEPLTAYHHHHHHHMPRITTHTHTLHSHVGNENTPLNNAGRGNVGLTAKPGRGCVGAGNSTKLSICDIGSSTSATKETKNGELLQITLKDHPSMSFRNKGHVDIEVRYKPTITTKNKPLLEKIIVTETDKCPLVKPKSPLNNKGLGSLTLPLGKTEKPGNANKEPWGKRGPGGKPWRSPKEAGSTFMKSLGWTNKEMLKELDQDNPVTPAEKPNLRKKAYIKKPKRCCDLCVCTCPGLSSSPTKEKTCTPPNILANAQPASSVPFKPQNRSKMDSIKQKVCSRFQRRCAGEGTTTETSANICNLGSGGGVELVPLLARRRANNRPISLSSTDVTKRTASNDRRSEIELSYMHDLDKQVTQKRRSKSLSKQMDKQLSERHFETFDDFWGRPGHGAPLNFKINKLKLDNLLYGNDASFTE